MNAKNKYTINIYFKHKMRAKYVANYSREKAQDGIEHQTIYSSHRVDMEHENSIKEVLEGLF